MNHKMCRSDGNKAAEISIPTHLLLYPNFYPII